MEKSNIQELLSEESLSTLEKLARYPGATTPWSNPVEAYDLLSPFAEKEMGVAAMIYTAMERLPERRDAILSLAQKCWGSILDAEAIVADNNFLIGQIHATDTLDALQRWVEEGGEFWSSEEVEEATRLRSLLEIALSNVRYVALPSPNISRELHLRRTWSNQMFSNTISSRLHSWLYEVGYPGSAFSGRPSPEQFPPILLAKWSRRAAEWQGGYNADLAVETLYQRRSISPVKLLELTLLEEEYNLEWAAAAF